ncbi:ras association domain-containing protein 10 [Nerophis lumbriciformis]|uniref:ras association domain-containing protein 10 n=1 Tax=Nerophis lumbriciformis TaxID=546530 RepID=UPI002ADFEB36|nr:ras association domain-containing protein 10-like [Nerophis lumbriciformis]
MEAEEGSISVWVCREEKIVVGLNKRTTCSDVLKVLLEYPNIPTHRCYAIVETWRSCQRILPNKTRIWRLWTAWGEERDQVSFMLADSDMFVEKRAARSAEARVVLLGGPAVSAWSSAGPRVEGHLPPDTQRRVVRKAFRKLEKMQQKTRRDSSASSEKMQKLSRLVDSQDNSIRLQARRIHDLDAEIERHEARVHVDRSRSHGVNYVQDTYLSEEDAVAASGQQVRSLEGFLHLCAHLVRLQEQVCEQEAVAHMLSVQLEEELNRRWMQRRLRETHADPQDRASRTLEEEEERLRSQLDVSSCVGLRLRSDLEAIRGDLELSRQICGTREKEMRDLLDKMNSLGLEDAEGGPDEAGGMRMMMMMMMMMSEWEEQARGLSKCHGGNDDDSDTGLSSLHSQESDCTAVCESLV